MNNSVVSYLNDCFLRKGFILKEELITYVKKTKVNLHQLLNVLEYDFKNVPILENELDALKYIQYIKENFPEQFQSFKNYCFEVLFNNPVFRDKLTKIAYKNVSFIKGKDTNVLVQEFIQEIYLLLVEGYFDRFIYTSEINVLEAFSYYIMSILQKAKRNIMKNEFRSVSVPSYIIDTLATVSLEVDRNFPELSDIDRIEVIVDFMKQRFPNMSESSIRSLLEEDYYLSDSEFMEKKYIR
ncbi:hypothetical protein DEFDS_P236 (plasmid) [Deferribacter desulfuricans SSM1]|uniref:Uncharacterized protein n=1 Tax=Deferribacter desulfuricans (strain DSM 14783 / JCM 11476 / NBRC 101012 / SSM1) TaxID=639282 RepID=D3PF64_DEFDS|nr:hypothetical protein [Deferribacter desulfuricans]BAI81856.1 hypothetical protein DEFDS_P236 [Deferribacter desulfuricans SSM1]